MGLAGVLSASGRRHNVPRRSRQEVVSQRTVVVELFDLPQIEGSRNTQRVSLSP
jgi:hypothetical protein